MPLHCIWTLYTNCTANLYDLSSNCSLPSENHFGRAPLLQSTSAICFLDRSLRETYRLPTQLIAAAISYQLHPPHLQRLRPRLPQLRKPITASYVRTVISGMTRSSYAGAFPAHIIGQKENLQLLLLLVGALLSFYLAYNGIVRPHTYHRGSVSASGSQWRSSWSAQADGHQDAYTAAAIANITRFRNTLLSSMVPKMKIKGMMPNFGLKPADWKLFDPMITCPPNRPLTHYGGDGDGSKYLCNVGNLGVARKDCVIYSMGSRGDYKFEQDMIKNTPCEIHTFDCTFNGTSLGPRHTYHKWCVAAAATARDKPAYRSWSNITKTLGHRHVDLLKIDIDGYEYEVLGELQPDSAVLPSEIGIEVHVMIQPKATARPWLKSWLKQLPDDIPHTVPALGLFFFHLANLGYGIYSQDTNTGAPECCSEFSLLRIAGAAAQQQ